MKLKQLNSGVRPSGMPANWTPDKRFIIYEYAPMEIPETSLPQSPHESSGAQTEIKAAFQKLYSPKVSATKTVTFCQGIKAENMSETMQRLLRYIMARLKEPSTYPAIILILTACGAHLSPDQRAAILEGGLIAAGLIGAALPDRMGKQSRADDLPPPPKGTP